MSDANADPAPQSSLNPSGSNEDQAPKREPEFAIQLDRDLSSTASSRLRPPPNYQSTKVRVQLMVLVFAFLLVLVLMNEARKPENWAWMGFDREGSATSVESDRVNKQNSGESSAAISTAAPNSLPPLGEGDPLSPNDGTPNRSPLNRSSYETWHEGIWQRILAELSPSDLRSWVGVWLTISPTKILSAVTPNDSQSVYETIDRLLNQELATESELLNRDTNATPEQISWPKKSLQDWQAMRQALSDEQTGTVDPRIPYPADYSPDRWRQRLWSVAISAVKDRTEMTRLADGPAWLLVWQRVLQSADSKALEVSHYALMSQPERYRGEPVRIVGELRGIESIQVPRNELGVEGYYALWIKPPGAGTVPYCVYASDLPGNISPPTRGWSDVKLPIAVDGIFFKLRSYLTSKDQVEICPLILSRQVQFLDGGLASTANSVTPAPTNWAIIAYMALLPLAAAWVAWRIYDATRRSPRRSLKHATTSSLSLDELRRQSEIQSTRERLSQMSIEQKDQRE